LLFFNKVFVFVHLYGIIKRLWISICKFCEIDSIEVNDMALKRFIDITDFTREELRETLNQFAFIKDNKSIYSNELNGKTVVNAFFEPDSFVNGAYQNTVSRAGGTAI